MNSSKNREFIASALMLVAVNVGAWFLFVQPKANELAHLKTEIIQTGSESAQFSGETVEQFARQVAGTRLLVQGVVERNRAADDSSQLYTIITNIAQKSSIQIQSLNPGSVPSLSADGSVIVTPIEVNVVGEYSQIAEFLDSIMSIKGFIRPSSLTVAPIVADQQCLVGARFTCQVLHFNLSDILVKVGDSLDASQSTR